MKIPPIANLQTVSGHCTATLQIQSKRVDNLLRTNTKNIIEMENFKPNNYNSVSPYFMVDDADRMMKQLTAIFDAKIHRRYDKPDGKIMHVELQIDDSIIMLSNSTTEYPANKYWMHVYVPNVDELFQKAIKLGCEIVDKPKIKENDPDKRGTFKDFAGNMWSVATQN